MTNQHPITPPPELVQQWSDAHWRLSMTDQHPITPPLELVQQWSDSSPIQHSDESWAYELFIADQAARWSSDQELEACVDFVQYEADWNTAEKLRAARRPKPPSLKERLSKAIVDGDEREALKLLEALSDD